MNKIKYKIIGISIVVFVFVAAMIISVVYRVYGKDSLKDVVVNQLENIKIYVRFVNSKRIYLETFFPLDSSTMISDNYALQRKNGDEWSAIGKDTGLELEYGVLNGRAVDDERYPEVGFESHQYEFTEDYGSLDKGSYRIVFGAKSNGKEYYLAVPFDITLEYEYIKEPTEYKYTVTTNFGEEELADQYEKCKDYITYSEFPLGFENQTFCLDLYKHLKKTILFSGTDKIEIVEEDRLREIYQYFAGAVMTRTDGGIYGATFFTDVNTLYYKTMQPPQKKAKAEQICRVVLLFNYGGKTKKINCKISGHSMIVETEGFAFREQISERFPLGELLPVEEEEKMVMEFYVFNEIEKALEGIK